MTLLTPNFTDHVKANGSAGPQVIAAHEPAVREGEQPSPPAAPHKPTAGAVAAPLKIALIGTAPSSRMLAPFDDPTWTIWGCSPGNMNILKRVDVWFELHSNLLWPEHESYGKPYLEWLNKQTFPIFMQDQSQVPKAKVFPKNALVAKFGDSFFTSSFAWMMAFAIEQGAAEIALFGIDMASRDEYILQRPGFFFFRHMANQRGIKVSAPHESDIMQSPALYAYVDSTPFGRKLMARKQEVTGRVGGMKQQRDQLNGSITYLEGALEDIDYMSSIWSGVANEMGQLQYENEQLKRENTRLQQLNAQPVFSMSSGTIPLVPPPQPDVVIEAQPQPKAKSGRRSRA